MESNNGWVYCKDASPVDKNNRQKDVFAAVKIPDENGNITIKTIVCFVTYSGGEPYWETCGFGMEDIYPGAEIYAYKEIDYPDPPEKYC